jgi:hypothetical protein
LFALKSIILCPIPFFTPVQARLDEETVSLSKRQQNYARDRDQLTQEEEEEYERAVEESLFR